VPLNPPLVQTRASRASDAGSIPIARSINPVDAVEFTGFPPEEYIPPPIICIKQEVRFGAVVALSDVLQSQVVVHRMSQFLFASQIMLGRLNRCVPKQELSLIKFSPSQVAQSRTVSFLVCLLCLKSAPALILAASVHSSMARFVHTGTGTVRMCFPLPIRSAITQCSSRT
jgi:hypothetical protein